MRCGGAGRSWGLRGCGLWGHEGCLQGSMCGGWRRGQILGPLGHSLFLVALAAKGVMCEQL